MKLFLSRCFILFFLLALASAFIIAAHSAGASKPVQLTEDETNWLRAHPEITLAVGPAYPPIGYFDDRGIYRGITADQTALIEAIQPLKFKILRMQSRESALRGVANHEADVMWVAATALKVPEDLLLTGPFHQIPSVIVVRDDVRASLSLADLKGMRVAVVAGDVDHDYLAANHPQLDLTAVADSETGLKLVSIGLADAFIDNIASTSFCMGKAGITNLRIAGNSGYIHSLSLAVRKDWPGLHSILQKTLDQIGIEEKDALFNKWVHYRQGNILARRDVLAVLSLIVLFTFGLLLWNRSLKKLVGQRTRELTLELAERNRVEHELRESEQRFRALVETTSDWVWEMDVDNRYTYVSPKIKDLLGYECHEMIGKTPFYLMPESESEPLAKAFAEIKASRKSFMNLENINYHRDGSRVILETSGVPIFTASGDFAGYRGIDRDITARKSADEALARAHEALEERVVERTSQLTQANEALGAEILERKKAEAALQAAHQQIQDIIEFLPDATFVINEEKRVIFWNRAIEKMTGVAKEDVLGKGEYAYALPFYGEKRPILIDLVMSNQMMLDHRYDFIERKDKVIFGEVFVPQTYEGRGAYLWGTASALFDKDNNIVGAIQSIRDISDRKNAEKALRLSEEKFRAIFESAQECIYLKNSSLVFTLVNPAMLELFRMSASECIGKTDDQIFGAETGHLSTDKRVLEGEVIHEESTGIIRGEAHTFHNIKVPIRDQDGNIIGLCGIARDITQRKRAEKALIQSEQQLRFLSSRLLTIQEEERKKVAQELHDSIGQYLVAIKMNIESILRLNQGVTDEVVTERLDRLLPIIQNALADVRRIYMGLRPTVLDDLGLAATVHWICREFQKSCPSIHIEDHVEVDESVVSEDLKVVLFRIIQEALNNVAKHSGADLVNLLLIQRNSIVELMLRDNGQGFDPQGALGKKVHERGFGLTGMKERTELSGGTFLLESSTHQGTTIKASWSITQSE
ncbi:MAG: PAS domain S-box protein [Desulfobacteraceae bacterium]|nr:PAS domain S-box protein [Desulfobacteraceae bacterium]